MRVVLLALVAAAVAFMGYVLADAPATAVLSASDIEAAKAVNKQPRARSEAAGSFATSSSTVDFDVDVRENASAASAAKEAEAARRPANAQRLAPRRDDAEARAQKRAWTGTFFDR